MAFLLNTCSENPFQPKQEDNVPPGRRDYTWTEDTIKTSEEVILTRIWGNTPTDIWAIGISSSIYTSVWHYNGISWTCDSSGIINPWSIIGFSGNEVWLNNANFSMKVFNGSSWQAYGEYELEGYDHIYIANFCGDSRSNIYGVGYAGNNKTGTYEAIIMHYNGNEWSFVEIPKYLFGFTDAVLDGNNLLLVAANYEQGYVGKLVLWNNKEFLELYTGHQPAITKINEVIYVTIEQKIYEYRNHKLKLLMDKTGSEFIGKIWGGRSSKDFFWCAYGGIGHFNGSDLKNIYPNDYELAGGIVFEKEVFFITQDYNRTGYSIVLHGKLE